MQRSHTQNASTSTNTVAFVSKRSINPKSQPKHIRANMEMHWEDNHLKKCCSLWHVLCFGPSAYSVGCHSHFFGTRTLLSFFGGWGWGWGEGERTTIDYLLAKYSHSFISIVSHIYLRLM